MKIATALAEDPQIKGLWAVPNYSNPTGVGGNRSGGGGGGCYTPPPPPPPRRGPFGLSGHDIAAAMPPRP
nr:hypothetical protein [Nocardia cyriacigeorgica]